MAVPKKKMSRSRTRRRKATWKASRPDIVKCPACEAPTRPHRVCPGCGSYNGRQVIDVFE